MNMPCLLNPKETVALIATSGPCDSKRLQHAVKQIEKLDLNPVVFESCRKKYGYLSGTDHTRLSDLHEAFLSRDVRGIFVLRGGYGAGRLLPHIDYEMIKQNPKIFVGFSDVTALHIVLNQFCNLVTFHGPMPGVDTDYISWNWLKSMIMSAHTPVSIILNPKDLPAVTVLPGITKGVLTGGNLSLLTASLGTPYEVSTKGRILFIEEINEDPYKIDRMFLQLKLAGKFRDAAGFILGSFAPNDMDSLSVAIKELILPEGKPTLAGLACGHTTPNLTLPLGREVILNALKGTIELS